MERKINHQILIMGVCASGKTTIARLIAERLDLPFLEADQFHPPENINKMSQGRPLDDNDRQPWLEKIAQSLKENEKKGFVLACSALKASYRAILQKDLEKPITIFYLNGSFEQILDRISKRKDHFMPESLVKSQFDDLEIPQNAIHVDIEKSPSEIASLILQFYDSKIF